MSMKEVQTFMEGTSRSNFDIYSSRYRSLRKNSGSSLSLAFTTTSAALTHCFNLAQWQALRCWRLKAGFH